MTSKTTLYLVIATKTSNLVTSKAPPHSMILQFQFQQVSSF